MDWASSEFIQIVSFLLPGFVAAGVFHSLTAHPKPSQFERVIFALILTAIINAVLALITSQNLGTIWSNEGTLALAVVLAIFIGLIFTVIANQDLFHRILRKLRITRETAFPTEWYSAFIRRPQSYIVLHMEGQRRLYGWPEEWPSSPDTGHFLMGYAEWLIDEDDDQTSESIPLANVESIVVPVSAVEMVEFMEPPVPEREDSDGKITQSPTGKIDKTASPDQSRRSL